MIYFLFNFKGYHHVENNLKKAMQTYGPAEIAYILVKKQILSPTSNYIMTTLNQVPISYQSSVMLRLLKVDMEHSSKYRNLVHLVRTEKSLRHMYSRRSEIG